MNYFVVSLSFIFIFVAISLGLLFVVSRMTEDDPLATQVLGVVAAGLCGFAVAMYNLQVTVKQWGARKK